MDNTAQPRFNRDQSNIFAPARFAESRRAGETVPAGRKWITPRNIFIILGIIVVVELILGLRSVTAPSSGSPVNNAPVESEGAFVVVEAGKSSIELTTDLKEVKAGDTVSVKVEVTSSRQAAGLDVVVKYDPELLSTTDGGIHQGTIFPQYPLAKVEPAGTVRISGIAGPGAPGFSGKDVFATVNFKALNSGVAKITLDFTPGQTADSNIVGTQGEKDLLEEVQNLEVVVR